MRNALLPLVTAGLLAMASPGLHADLLSNLNNRLNQAGDRADATERSADEQLEATRRSTDAIDTLTGSNLSRHVEDASARKTATSQQADEVERGASTRLNALRTLTGSAD